MKIEIRQILFDNLISNYDNGNIENGGVGGGDEAVDELYTLFAKKLLESLENLDSNRMLGELAASRRGLTKTLDKMAFNANGGDTNGNQTKYAILKDEIDKVDALILVCVDKLNK